jgi:hypothetical protein
MATEMPQWVLDSLGRLLAAGKFELLDFYEDAGSGYALIKVPRVVKVSLHAGYPRQASAEQLPQVVEFGGHIPLVNLELATFGHDPEACEHCRSGEKGAPD